jgi:adenylate cyclase
MSKQKHPAINAAAFFDLAIDLFCIAGVDGSLKKVNPSFERTLGYTSEELLSRPFIELVHPDDQKATRRELDRLARRKDTAHFEVRARCKDGGYRWLAFACSAPSDTEDLLYAVARDITAQIEAEAQLRIRDSIFTSMQNGLLITDPLLPDNPIVYCNQAFCDLTGYTPDEFLGRNCRFLQGEDRSQPQLEVLRAALKKARTCRVLLRNYRKDGSMFWNELVISPVKDEDGNPTHFVGLQYDVSEIVHANADRWRKLSKRLKSLALRQRQVLDLLVAGETMKSIARQLGISAKTVEVHRARVLEKMGVDTTVDLVRLVVSNQL